MIIKVAKIDHLNELVILFEKYRKFYGKEEDHKAATNFIKERVEKKDSIIGILFDKNYQAIGFTQLYPLFSSTRMKKLWLLNDLFIDVEFRGNGHSLLLLDWAKKLCVETGAAGLMLETAKTNEVGNKLYPKAGFILDEEYNHYEWNPMIS